jgi:hypothetical protein
MIDTKMLAAIVATGVMALAATPASAGCVRAGASATAVTSELATVLAKEALYNSDMFAGRKARGAVSVKCDYIGVVTTCKARQVACT